MKSRKKKADDESSEKEEMNMATVEKRGNSYRIIVHDGYDSEGNRITYRKSVKRPPDLDDKKWQEKLHRFIFDFEEQINKGVYIDEKITLKDFSERWMKDYCKVQLQETTTNSYQMSLDSNILPALGHMKLSKIKPMNILTFLNSLLKDGVRKDGKSGGYSDRTIKYQWQILSSMFQQAVYWQVLLDNPCSRVKVPKNKKPTDYKYVNDKIDFFDENQVAVLLELIEDEPIKFQVAVHIALWCGLRQGEILGLTWNDIDTVNKTMNVNKARYRSENEGMKTKMPKSASSIRRINMPVLLVNLLNEYKVWQNGQKVKCGDAWSSDWDKNLWLMTQWNGEGMHYHTLSHWLTKTIKRHNKRIMDDKSLTIQDKKAKWLPVLSFHKLRHTSATLLIAGNQDIKSVSMRLGHSTPSITMNIYAHGLTSSDQKAANYFDEMYMIEEEKKKQKPAEVLQFKSS
jgi:integrase